MPNKHAVKERAWGSRYDTLKSSPSSPSANASPSANMHSPNSTQATATAAADDDDKPSDGAALPIVATKIERPNNDSSIFVGSLPTNIDLPELNNLLAVHFSVYPQVKDVKAIRDNNRGSVCAFVQCEDADAASRLLKTLQESQTRPFQGRFLRFEFARASRTLVVAYRTPPQYAYPNSGFDDAIESDPLHLNVGSELPTAMRLFRPRNSKYPTILYDSEATTFDAKAIASVVSPEIPNTAVPEDGLSGAGVLIDSLKYDAETLRKIALAFGPLEHFCLFLQNKDVIDDASKVSKGFGDVPRSPCMEAGPWEIKWERREDCMNASMTLRRIPHLIVSWAHRLDSDSASDSRFGSPTSSPGSLYPSMSRMRNTSRPHASGGEYQRFGDSHGHFSPNFLPSSGNLRLSMSSSPGSFSDTTRSPDLKHWSPTRSSPNIRGPTSPLATRQSADGLVTNATVMPELNEVDFPPLYYQEGVPRVRKTLKPLSLPWVQRDPQPDGVGSVDRASASPSSSLSVQPSTPPLANDEDEPTAGPPDSPAANDDVTDQGQEVIVPPTPEFTTSSITPITPKTANSYPLTPQSVRSGSEAGDASRSPGGYHTTPRKVGRFVSGAIDEAERERDVDPSSLFVGNLEIHGANPWTEERLRSIFDKYGVIEDVKLYEPAQKVVAFAFIKYADAESCVRAIAIEHQRLYDGRPIRVQLRELKSHLQRTPFKIMRGRGRPRIFDDSPHRHAGGMDFNTSHPYDDYVPGVSPRSFNGRPIAMSYHDSRYAMSRASSETLHFSANHDAAELSSRAAFHPAHTLEHKAQSLHDDTGGTVPWRQDSYPQDVHPERSMTGSSATSASISPPPSSASSQPPSVVGAMQPYPMMMPWMHPYHPYAYPMHYLPAYMGYPTPTFPPYPHAQDASGTTTDICSSQPSWMVSTQMYKKPASHTADEQTTPQPYIQQTGTQPPLRPLGFESAAGALVPMYPPEALNQYMSAHGQVQAQTHGHTPPPPPPPPPPQAGATNQQQGAVAWPQYAITPGQMAMYPYPYVPQMHVGSGQMTVSGGQYPNVGSTWGAAPSTGYSAHVQTQTQVQVTPPPYVTPSSSSSTGPINASSSFGAPYGAAVNPQSEQTYNYRGNLPPRRGMNRAYGQNNRHMNPRASPNRCNRLTPGGQVEASYSFADTIPQSRSHQHVPIRASGSYPASYAMSSSVSGM